MTEKIIPLSGYKRTLVASPDKSITHRAVMLNAAARGSATVTNALMGDDCRSTIACMQKLGAKITVEGDVVHIEGAEHFCSADLDVGNSGTTIRLLSGLLCARKGTYTLTGDESIRRRPMKRIIEPLTAMGAHIFGEGNTAPLLIGGRSLHAINYTMPIASAQVKSAIVLAALGADGETCVTEPLASRDHTERMLTAMGANIRCEGNNIFVARSALSATDVSVPGDISSAAYPLVLAAVLGGEVTVRRVGVNPTRTGILDVFKAAGVDYRLTECGSEGGEPIADITVVGGGSIKPFGIDGGMIPSLIDEIPVLAVLAAFADGECVISGAQELKVKESDRIATTVNMLLAFGADARETDDGMMIRGRGGLKGGCDLQTYGDHRIAMSAAVAAAASDRGAIIRGSECADISYPDFYRTVRQGDE